MQLVNGDKPQQGRICPLGWNMLIVDTGGVIPGVPQQPTNVAPNCVEARCALWNEHASACSFAVMAVESQRRTDIAEQQLAAGLGQGKGAADVLNTGGEHAAPAGKYRQLDGDANGGPSRN